MLLAQKDISLTVTDSVHRRFCFAAYSLRQGYRNAFDYANGPILELLRLKDTRTPAEFAAEYVRFVFSLCSSLVCSEQLNRKHRLNLLAGRDSDYEGDDHPSPTPSQERRRQVADLQFLAEEGEVKQGPRDPILDGDDSLSRGEPPVDKTARKTSRTTQKHKRKRKEKFVLPPAAAEMAQALAEESENARSGLPMSLFSLLVFCCVLICLLCVFVRSE